MNYSPEFSTWFLIFVIISIVNDSLTSAQSFFLLLHVFSISTSTVNAECAYLYFNHVLKVLGAAMFYAKVGDAAMVYTGDYNMTPDRHLGAAQIDRMQLDLLITE